MQDYPLIRFQKPEAARIWRDALRSGVYEQCQGFLHFHNVDAPESPIKHCCLGVAKLVLGVDLRDAAPSVYDHLARALGIGGRSTKGEDGEVGYFIWLNDRDRASFLDIADYIDRCLEAQSAKDLPPVAGD